MLESQTEFRHNSAIKGGVAKWSKARVCKTCIRRFESARRLHLKIPINNGL